MSRVEKKPLTFPTLEACLIAREPIYLAQAAELRRHFDARVSDENDWLKDYQLRLEVQGFLRDDDPDYDEDDDNILVWMTFNMRAPFLPVEGGSHLYDCLRNDPLLSADSLNRIGFVWADIVVEMTERIVHPPTDVRGLNAVFRDVDARYADQRTNLADVLHARQEDAADWWMDHEIEFEIRSFTRHPLKESLSALANRSEIGRVSTSLKTSWRNPENWGMGHPEHNYSYSRPEHDIGENISYLYMQMWNAIRFPYKETDIDCIEAKLEITLQDFADIAENRVEERDPVPSARPAGKTANNLRIAFGKHVERGPDFPALFGATWNRHMGVIMVPLRPALEIEEGQDPRVAEEMAIRKLFAEWLTKRQREFLIRMVWLADDAGEGELADWVAEGVVVLDDRGIEGHFALLETLRNLAKHFGQEAFLFKSRESLNLELHRTGVTDGVSGVSIGQWRAETSCELLEIWRRETR